MPRSRVTLALIALLVLVVSFRSFVMAGMPLLTGVMGVMVGLFGITIATGFIDLGRQPVIEPVPGGSIA